MRLLALHAGYLCRHSGVCCTEAWAIPVEHVRHVRLTAALESGALRPPAPRAPFFEPSADLDPDASVVVGRAGRDCVFFDPIGGRLCAIHRDLGPRALPVACQHFPRVVVADPRGVTLTLSHVCPTAADLLFDEVAGWSEVVHHGRVVLDGVEWTGLDAREALPPQVHGSLLWDWDSMTAFEKRALDLLGRVTPRHALGIVDAAARSLSRFERGPLLTRVFEAFDEAEATGEPLEPDIGGLTALARRCVSGGPHPAERPPAADDAAWHLIDPQVSRYLAARLLASAVMYHALDVRVWSGWLQTSYAVLRSAFARECALDGTISSRAAVKAAAADADRLLVHRLDAARLASALRDRSGIRS
jgi:hypothetical protein